MHTFTWAQPVRKVMFPLPWPEGGMFCCHRVSYHLPMSYESATDCKPQAAQDCSKANIASLPPFTFSYIWRKQRFGSICDRTALFILIYTSRRNAHAWKKGCALTHTHTELQEPQRCSVPKPERGQQSRGVRGKQGWQPQEQRTWTREARTTARVSTRDLASSA